MTNAPIRTGLTLVALIATTLSTPVRSQETSPCLKLVKWPGASQETPAVCVVRNGWYFCILPTELKNKGISPPQLKSGALILETKILQIDPVHKVCLIERIKAPTETGIDYDDIPIVISSTKESRPGTQLTSMCPGNSCRTRIAGSDQQYMGKELAVPMLRVRVEDDSICKPGTPLINAKGELVALLTDRKLKDKKEAHAIPACVLKKMLTDYQNHQRTGPIWIGASFEEGTTTLEVLKVRKNSPAEKGGIQVGDIVLSVSETAMKNFPTLLEVFQRLPAGKEIKFIVLRGLDEKELTIVPEFAKTK